MDDINRAKRKEANDDIDSILQRMKPQKIRKGDLQNEVVLIVFIKEADEVINALSESMRNAAYNDQEFNRNGQPAIAKLKLLPSTMVHLQK